MSSGANFQRGLALIGGQRYDDAIASLKRSIELEPRFFVPSLALAYLYEKLGRAQEALALLDRPEFRPSAYLATAYARLGRRTEALAMLRALGGPKGISDRRSIALAYFAWVTTIPASSAITLFSMNTVGARTAPDIKRGGSLQASASYLVRRQSVTQTEFFSFPRPARPTRCT